jgi:hypothetical protein
VNGQGYETGYGFATHRFNHRRSVLELAAGLRDELFGWDEEEEDRWPIRHNRCGFDEVPWRFRVNPESFLVTSAFFRTDPLNRTEPILNECFSLYATIGVFPLTARDASLEFKGELKRWPILSMVCDKECLILLHRLRQFLKISLSELSGQKICPTIRMHRILHHSLVVIR